MSLLFCWFCQNRSIIILTCTPTISKHKGLYPVITHTYCLVDSILRNILIYCHILGNLLSKRALKYLSMFISKGGVADFHGELDYFEKL